ncbi:MAG: N-acetyltransferase, partial [Kofleriaceae bacterium]|nr:N-acetyltransferase [Kofleriaceae bacterium]
MSDITIRSLSSLERVDSALWDGLCHGDSPFQKYGFLRALELSESVGPGTGWLPQYLLVEEDGELLGACAAYLKTDSYGEYIFDWAWARASPRFGVSYYPKLVVAAPFTPATGNRLLIAPEADRELVQRAIASGIVGLCEKHQLSGAHVLFCTDNEAAALEKLGLARRSSVQYHWHNRDYTSFDEFLAALKSRKRKQIRKERSRAQAAVDSIEFVFARDWQEEDFEALDRFYRKTVAEHGGFDYLRPGFFRHVAECMSDTVLYCRVINDGVIVAGALFFET